MWAGARRRVPTTGPSLETRGLAISASPCTASFSHVARGSPTSPYLHGMVGRCRETGLNAHRRSPFRVGASASGHAAEPKTKAMNKAPCFYSSLIPNEGSESTPQTAQEKAKRRREQIRKAQTQHRERKEVYQKELEVDVAQIQDAAEQAERERERLRTENAEIRAMLGKLENFPALPSATDIKAPVHERLFWYQMGDLDKYWKLGQGGTASLGQDNGLSVEKTVTMIVDETMQYPCYQVLPSPPSSTEGYSSEASLDEEDFAINFILAYVPAA